MVPRVLLSPRVVLASASSQRREILTRLGVEFDVVIPEVEELRDGDPAEEILENARLKAAAVYSGLAMEGTIVIGCDTDVVLGGRAIGKPENLDQAREHLRSLSGVDHDVLSGLFLIGPREGEERSGIARSTVHFRQLDDQLIERYVATGEWQGRAGGYAVQGLGSALVSGVTGEIANVIGFPVGLLWELAPELLANA